MYMGGVVAENVDTFDCQIARDCVSSIEAISVSPLQPFIHFLLTLENIAVGLLVSTSWNSWKSRTGCGWSLHGVAKNK